MSKFFHQGLLILMLVGMSSAPVSAAEPSESTETASAALSVTLVTPTKEIWPQRIKGSGQIRPWQDALVAAETGGLRISALQAEVGDVVKRGQLMATLASDAVLVDIAVKEAKLAQANAQLGEARANANRSRSMKGAGAMSSQQIDQYLMGEKTAEANVALAQAELDGQRLRLSQTQVLAPDDGIIYGRNAMLGQVVSVGTELFRIIRQSRLIWLAEVSADEATLVKTGQAAVIHLPGGIIAQGVVRIVNPALDVGSLNALVSVSVLNNVELRFGMFGHGEIIVGDQAALCVPQTAISWRDGKSYLFTLDNETRGNVSRVVQKQVRLGRRAENRVEVLQGLQEGERVVESGAAFLSDGDRVRLVSEVDSVADHH